jgi:hypothetical protein
MATKTAEEKTAAKAKADADKAAKVAAEKAEADRRAALTQEERDAEDAAKAASSTSAPAKAKATEPVTVKYLDHVGNPTERTFSKDVHGDNFAELAEEFKATNATRLIA